MAGETNWHLVGIWTSWNFLRGPQVFKQLHLVSLHPCCWSRGRQASWGRRAYLLISISSLGEIFLWRNEATSGRMVFRQRKIRPSRRQESRGRRFSGSFSPKKCRTKRVSDCTSKLFVRDEEGPLRLRMHECPSCRVRGWGAAGIWSHSWETEMLRFRV